MAQRYMGSPDRIIRTYFNYDRIIKMFILWLGRIHECIICLTDRHWQLYNVQPPTNHCFYIIIKIINITRACCCGTLFLIICEKINRSEVENWCILYVHILGRLHKQTCTPSFFFYTSIRVLYVLALFLYLLYSGNHMFDGR